MTQRKPRPTGQVPAREGPVAGVDAADQVMNRALGGLVRFQNRRVLRRRLRRSLLWLLVGLAIAGMGYGVWWSANFVPWTTYLERLDLEE